MDDKTEIMLELVRQQGDNLREVQEWHQKG